MREPTKRCIVNQSKIQTRFGRAGKRLDWIQFPTKIKNTSFAPGNIDIRWYEDGILNVSYNCLDRHLQGRGDQTAIIWEGDDPSSDEEVTYRDLYERVCRFANGLRSQGVKKGDVVTLYMPMIPEAAWRCLRVPGSVPFTLLFLVGSHRTLWLFVLRNRAQDHYYC